MTDGGHYENLGLVELLRRGCTEIYCFDASNDNLDALGDAIALARSELGVEIDFESEDDPSHLLPDEKTSLAKTDCVVGQVRFPGGNQRGRLYYARTVMTAGAPEDVVVYHRRDPRFPHDPTVDQLYTDQKFEAYRELGAHASEEAVKAVNSRPTWSRRTGPAAWPWRR